MGGMMKQVQKMQQQMAKAQEELASLEIEATSGGGMVTVRANGQNEILEIKIKQEVVDPDDIEMLEDLVLAAVNEALNKSGAAASEHMAKATGPLAGMLPPGMKIPGL
ncbi:MAG: YbaB/EbfC family nucleoid-associated protein [Candidatus Electryonea clarkiae]|nr:YbaB/EbfC family nucleoid-associated protein [Candidatus Electryonea clarkiae]MDP8285817.1 YbaB/EbfC family nucleoid-associated protein [Candidatus Electryonea clarkiae]